MSTTLLPPNDDDNTSDNGSLKPKKDRVIQPLSPSQDETKASDALLAELRKRTAELAAHVHGSDEPLKRVLNLDDTSTDEAAIIEALKSDRPDATKQTTGNDNANPAAALIRKKLDRLYKREPDAADEAIEAYQAGAHRSKHQQFMYDLTTSGKSLADIQTAWHRYYIDLPNDEKHEVWKEFYETQSQAPATITSHLQTPTSMRTESAATIKKHHNKPAKRKRLQPHGVLSSDNRTVADVKRQMLNRVSANGKLTPMQNVKSLLFGVGMASLVGLIMTFAFFNEAFVAPFISPSRNVSATPIIGTQSGRVGPEPKIIIPKINLEVPVVFDMTTIEENAVQKALEDGVVHYATSPNPGEQGNVVIVGHSSNNILNSGRYKFAFVLLKRLESQDTFFVQKDGIRYTYKVYKKEIVEPTDVSVLRTQDKPNTITLITCDPPGTSLRRLIIVAEQISPNPDKNAASTALQVDEQSAETLPSNAPTLWSRLWPF